MVTNSHKHETVSGERSDVYSVAVETEDDNGENQLEDSENNEPPWVNRHGISCHSSHGDAVLAMML